jgi:hypothetical protein
VKRYRLDVEESEPLQAVYDKSRSVHRLAIYGAALCPVLGNFASALDDVTLVLDAEALILRSHLDSPGTDSVAKRPFYTEWILNPRDLVAYELHLPAGDNIALTINLKDLRAVATFAERQGQPLLLYAEEEGVPLLCSIAVPGSFEADFVFAILSATPDSTSTVSQEASSASATGRGGGPGSNSSSVLGKRSRSDAPIDGTTQPKRIRRSDTASPLNAAANSEGNGSDSATGAAEVVDSGADASSSAVLWTRRALSADAMMLDNGDVPDSDNDDS